MCLVCHSCKVSLTNESKVSMLAIYGSIKGGTSFHELIPGSIVRQNNPTTVIVATYNIETIFSVGGSTR